MHAIVHDDDRAVLCGLTRFCCCPGACVVMVVLQDYGSMYESATHDDGDEEDEGGCAPACMLCPPHAVGTRGLRSVYQRPCVGFLMGLHVCLRVCCVCEHRRPAAAAQQHPHAAPRRRNGAQPHAALTRTQHQQQHQCQRRQYPHQQQYKRHQQHHTSVRYKNIE